MGVAFVFMSLAIIPFSLKAAGVHFNMSLSRAVDALTQMAGVFSTSNISIPTVEWTVRQLNGEHGDRGTCENLLACGEEQNEPAPDLPALPEIQGPIAEPTTVDQLHPTCPLTKSRRPAGRSTAIAAGIPVPARVHIKLPVSPRELAEVLRWSPGLAEGPEVTVDATVLIRDRRVKLAEALKKFATRRDFQSMMKYSTQSIVKFSTQCPQAGPPARVPSPASPTNRTT